MDTRDLSGLNSTQLETEGTKLLKLANFTWEGLPKPTTGDEREERKNQTAFEREMSFNRETHRREFDRKVG